MTLILVETKIERHAIHMRYADHPDLTQATEWIEFRIKLEGLMHPLVQGKPVPLGDPESQFVSEVQLASLRRVRDAIGEETQRLSELIGRIR